MNKLLCILSLLLLMAFGCSPNDPESLRQTYIHDNGDTICIYYNGSMDEIYVKNHNGEGWCNVINEPHPIIHDIKKDTIIVRYNLCHSPRNSDIVQTAYTEQIFVGKSKYFVKGEYDYYYNGNAIGSIDGKPFDSIYHYYIDSISHIKDTISFFRGTNLLYKANQRDVVYNLDKNNTSFEAFYTTFVKRDDYVYKIINSIYFIKK
ncbi:MAG: hypothetical protein J6V33_10455 [Bacteroidales bacterium]|nr:hypothetical protein [Bacteroidales bacterium]